MPDFSHAVVGAGVVGLAIAARLARAGARVIVLEKNPAVGQETSSRNSEVIHAGVYHPPDSLRTQLCIQGKHMLYETAAKTGIELRNCGKWIVAQNESQAEYLEKMKSRAKLTGVPLDWLPLDRAKTIEPAVRARAAILESPTSGIISAHSLMDYYEAEIQKYGGDISLLTQVTGLAKSAHGYDVTCVSQSSTESEPEEPLVISTDSVINAAGLWAPHVQNMLLPEPRHHKAFYAKGSYYSYSPSRPKVDRLIYPVPDNFGSLGTHLTIDLAGRLRFGPDFEWVSSPQDLEPSAHNLEAAKEQIKQYIDIDTSQLVPDYSGLRPKIIGTTEFQDFIIRQEDGFPGFINLLNIESPGLTSSMAIAEYVHRLL